MIVEFSGEVWYWRGPAPFYFVSVPDEPARAMKSVERLATFGWGMIPAYVTIGSSRWYTAIFPKDGAFLVPVKAAIRKAEKIEEGQTVDVKLEVLMTQADFEEAKRSARREREKSR